jgi:intracellular proteinase inhibitor BsuPI
MKRFIICAAALLVASACSSETTAPIESQSDAARAADTFAHLADSVNRSGGDADVGGAYAAIAGAVRAGGRVAPITLSIDGASASFVGTVVVSELSQRVYCVVAPCPPISQTIRSLIAWDKDNPKRVVQLTSSADDEPIAAVLYPSLLASYVPMASLIYMDGAGGTYFGTSGTQRLTESNTKSLCPAPNPPTTGKDSVLVGIARPNVGVCTLTDAAITFSGKAEPSPFLVAQNSATGTHAIAMATQSVPGTHTVFSFPSCDTSCTAGPYPPPRTPEPPVVVRPSNELPAQLGTIVASAAGNEVTLTLTVKNPNAAPIDVTFPSGQKYDFVVTDSLTGKDVWRWSATRSFIQSVQRVPVPANGALTFTEKWTPPAKGLYLAHGLLVSTSHRAEAYASVIVR